MNALKERVKCANCGMVYDRLLPDMMPDTGSAQCPKCKSNAYDAIEKPTWKKQYAPPAKHNPAGD